MDLFDHNRRRPERREQAPLAERMRPHSLDTFVGQSHLVGEGTPLRHLLASGEVPSLILWGPPGCGKTTLARIIAGSIKADFFQLNAVASGVAELRKVIERAEVNRDKLGKRTILFIDEIHRFNKAQQDALLHSVEEGVLTLIGATTENPSFEVIAPLLSRCFVYVLNPLGADELGHVISEAVRSDAALAAMKPEIAPEVREILMQLAGGDARLVLNGLEAAVRSTKPASDGRRVVTRKAVEQAFQRRALKYDKDGEEHYNIISAFIKSLRGCDPDGAVYWLARMLEAGEDPLFIARRMVVLASEDVGNADPAALPLAMSSFAAVDAIGMPEARIVLAHAATYLAAAPKSNAAYMAVEAALGDVRAGKTGAVPLHLRNAPTQLMKDLRYGTEYKYGHAFDGHFTPQEYLPEELRSTLYYRPSDNGREADIKARLRAWWKERNY
jgi:putative ATPase